MVKFHTGASGTVHRFKEIISSASSFFDDVTFASTSGSQDLRPVLELHLAGERDVRVAAPGLGGNVLLRAQQVKASLVTNLGSC